MKKWNYKVLTIAKNESENQLNSYGEKGWELVNIILCNNPDYITAFLKKEID